jgi:hypothetical protein
MIKFNKYLTRLAITFASLTLLACNSGGSDNVVIPPLTEYTYTQLNLNTAQSSQTCISTVTDMFSITCPASTSVFNMDASYSSIPMSYLVIPSQSSLPSGLYISQTGVCSTSAVTNYSCNITITATHVTSGTVVQIPISGQIGQKPFYSVIFQ